MNITTYYEPQIGDIVLEDSSPALPLTGKRKHSTNHHKGIAGGTRQEKLS